MHSAESAEDLRSSSETYPVRAPRLARMEFLLGLLLWFGLVVVLVAMSS